jgi:GNAT superfamily N-acetyltransferase
MSPSTTSGRTDGVVFRTLEPADSASFHRESTFRRYLADQEAGIRSVHVAVCEGQVAGCVTLLWTADDPAFRREGIPEISDLRVHEAFRGRGIGPALMERAEAEASLRRDRVGLNVGLHSGYGTR